MSRLIARHILTLHSSPPQDVAPSPEAVTMESDFVLILAALLCGLICLIGLAAMIRCAWLRQAFLTTTSPSSREAAAANKGLKKKVLQALPIYNYGVNNIKNDTNDNINNSKDHNNAEVVVKFACLSTECPICLGDFVEGDEIRVLPQCGHGFHVLCIDTWLGSHSSCPSCRQILVVARCHKCGHGSTTTTTSLDNNNNNNDN